MRTPGHAVVNLALVVQSAPPPLALAVVLGAVIPDLPIVVLFLLYRSQGVPRAEIWRVHYQKPFWINLIHGLHSIPLAALGALLGALAGSPVAAGFFLSLLLHDALDLPLHGLDAHRHFFPLSNWRFVSPLSYWDVTRHARWVTPVEWLLVLVATLWILPRASGWALLGLGAAQLYYLYGFLMLFLAPEPAT